MRILSICRSFPTPDDPSFGVFVHRRVSAMAKIADVSVLQPIPFLPLLKPVPSWAVATEREYEGLRIEHAPMFYLPGVLKSLDSYWLARSIAAPIARYEVLPDIIDAHFGYPEGTGGLNVARRLGIPFVVTLRGFEAEYLDKPIIGDQIRGMLKEADGCICVGDFLRKLAIENGAAEATTVTIHNATDRKQFFPGNRDEARKALGLDTVAPVLVTVGHLIPRKRHHIVVKALAKLKADFPDVQLHIIGNPVFEPGYVTELKRTIETLGLSDAVKLVGNLPPETVRRYLQAADAFVLGTQREGCCNAILEALACGCPVITTAVGDNDFFVRDGSNGFIVPVDDVDATAAATRQILQDRGRFESDQVAASLTTGSWHDVAARVVEFQSMIVERGKPSPGRG